MKRIILFFFIVLFIFPMTVSAENGVAITIVIPQSETANESPAAEPAPKTVKYLYPVNVTETHENGRHEIVKTYELGKGEKPEDISRESFIREGYIYELADITKKETSSTDTREYVEIVEQSSTTNDTETILKLFTPPSYEFINENGYKGTMTLDISTLKVEESSTKTNAFTVTAAREYPHLSSNDASLVPKTITDNGRTYNLSNIQWRTQNTVTVDSDQLPDSYTAVATYTRTAYSTTVTGYTATAEYRGTLSKVLTGKTVYTAYFTGIPIVMPTELIPATTEPETETTAESATELPVEAEVGTTVESMIEPATESETVELEIFTETTTVPTSETETAAESDTITETEPGQKPFNPIPVIIIIIIAVGLTGGFVYIFIIRKKGSVTL